MYNETRYLLYIDFAIQKKIQTISLTSKSRTHVDTCLVIRMQHNKIYLSTIHYCRSCHESDCLLCK